MTFVETEFEFTSFKTVAPITFNPATIYLFEVDNRNIRKRFDICSKSTIKTPEQEH